MTKDQAIDRAKRLAGVYERKKITANTLVTEIAGFARPEDVDDIMAALSPKSRTIFQDWILSLREDNGQTVVLWPLRPGLKAAFKKWLADYQCDARDAKHAEAR